MRALSEAGTAESQAQPRDDVACPFCGLLCDDVSVSASHAEARVVANGCARSRAMFAGAAVENASAFVAGSATDLDAAVARAARVLRDARHPRFVSAGSDVAAARALVELAEQCRGSVAHASAPAASRHLGVHSAWMATTLTEVRNRADLIVVAGEDPARRFPRFYERCFGEFETLFETGPRDAWFLGPVSGDLPASVRSRARSLSIDPARMAEAFAVMRALHAGRRLDAATAAGVPVGKLSELLERMRHARYGVLVWSSAGIAAAHEDLAIEAMCSLIEALNATGRFSVLPLGGSDGDLTLRQVTTWQTGFPAPVDFSSGAPAMEPALAHDAFLHVSALDPSRAPALNGRPTVVLGHPGMPSRGYDVFIPVGVPGVHHEGHLYRTDSVVAVPLRRVMDNGLLPAADVLRSILRELRETA